MKIHGRKIEGPNEVSIVIPRGDDDFIAFKARAVLDFSNFEKLCPTPKPPKSQRPGGEWFENPEAPGFKKQLEDHNIKFMQYIAVESLKATDGFEWEKVKDGDPDTWSNWRVELIEAGFNNVEIGRISQGILQANSLDEDKVKEARDSFATFQRERGATADVG